MSLEDLMSIEIDSVYGASGFKQKVTEAPASATIITSQEIQMYGYRTVADILRNVRGFYVTYDPNYSYLGVRGYGPAGDYNRRIAADRDGLKIGSRLLSIAKIVKEHDHGRKSRHLQGSPSRFAPVRAACCRND